MRAEKFGASMGVLVEQIVHLITENYEYDEMTASNEFYSSKVYALLEQEETKLWHLSPLTLFNLFDEEKKTGSFELAEEVAQARSCASSISTDKPRPAASAAIPAPLMPPPITIRSLVSMLPSFTFVKAHKCSLSNILAKNRALGNIEKTF